MSVRNWVPSEILQPRGAWTPASQLSKNYPARANTSINMRYFGGQYAYSREGTSAVAIGGFNSSAGKVGGMFNWISPNDNFLVYLDGTSIKRLDLSAGTVVTLGSAGASPRYPTIADLGPRVYAAAASTAGVGQITPFVSDESANTDTCFRSPLTATTFTASDGGAGGLCTLGTHRLAFLYTSRNGFTGQPSPISGGVLAYASVTLSAGLHHISLVIAFNNPGDAGGIASLSIIMTRADNLNNWFILPPSAVSGVTSVAAGNYSQTLTIDISDEDLANETSALPYFDYLVTNGVGTVAPPTPDFIVSYGKRMVYGSGPTLYISEINNPQAITADLNVVSNPSGRRVKYAFPLGQQLFVGGDKWTGSVRDNGDSPATWPPPSSISESQGPAFPNCVGGSTLTMKWIATEFGVYAFDGSFSDRPVTYLWNDTWSRVNWNAAYTIQITEDVINMRVLVAVPLDANTEPSHCFVIDYSMGNTWDTVDISLDNYGAVNFSSIQAVKEVATTNKTSIWLGPQVAGALLRLDATTHVDSGNLAIHAIWESSYVRRSGDIDTPKCRVGAVDIWAHGLGTLLHTWFSNDRVVSVLPQLLATGSIPGQIPLSTAPGIEYFLKGDLNPVENYTMRFEVNNPGDYFILSGFRSYSKRSLSNR